MQGANATAATTTLQGMFPGIDADVIALVLDANGGSLDRAVDVLLEMSSEAAGAAQAALPDDFLRPPSYFRIRTRPSQDDAILQDIVSQARPGADGLAHLRHASVSERVSQLGAAARQRFDRLRSRLSNRRSASPTTTSPFYALTSFDDPEDDQQALT
ncbi:unnamed protein product (mitochondrion) [Plasmodiophora brassicae]|uniref:CUE domain-containing protein n=1 Tax=Plasmodiophora brassicae TaxID=37360 RepID=A0A0G4J710_PLABS|nr:hypothetical protein PBRA_009337 [Plasmodiophora brassicae]SPQ99097.1 unnamed protein product [Plasmodiophora brassicae]